MTETEREALAPKPYLRPSLIGLVPYGAARKVAHGTAVGVESHRRHYQPLCDACSAYDAERRAS